MELAQNLQKHKERLQLLTIKNTDRELNPVGPEDNMNSGSVAYNLPNIREKEKSTFGNISKSIFLNTLIWPGKFSKKENLTNPELQGIFVSYLNDNSKILINLRNLYKKY